MAEGGRERMNVNFEDESACLRATVGDSQADGLLFVGVCRLCVCAGVVLLWGKREPVFLQ